MNPQLMEPKDTIARLNETIPWESFRSLLEIAREKPNKSNIERIVMNVIIMFIDVAIDIALESVHKVKIRQMGEAFEQQFVTEAKVFFLIASPLEEFTDIA